MIALIIIGLFIIIFSFTILTVAGRHYVKNGDSYEQKRGAFMKKLIVGEKLMTRLTLHLLTMMDMGRSRCI